MANLTKGSASIASKIKEHMDDHGWPHEKRVKLWQAVEKGEKQVFATLPISLIKESKNIRRGGDDSEIKKLADSIKNEGLLQHPVVCLEQNDNGLIQFTMAAGHRRLKAFRLLSRKEIDCAIKIFSNESERLISSFMENDVRKNMDVFDTALAYLKMKESGLSANDIASRTKKDISNINRFLKFNTWSDSLVTKIRSLDPKPALRDLFLLLSFEEKDIPSKLRELMALKEIKTKKEKKNNPDENSVRVPAHEKRYNKIKAVVEKYDIAPPELQKFSKMLREADIIRKSL